MPEHEFLAPSSSSMDPGSQRMTNEDFRKLMMTPRGGSGAPSATPTGVLGAAAMTPHPGTGTPKIKPESEKAEKRKKKKSYYAKLKKQEDDKMAELAAKYRDRAAERRDGGEEGPHGVEGADEEEVNTSGYRAVAPDVRSNFDAAERRKKMIQESKFLGGDMEHTHLVKGLDFALLQKVRSEIATHEVDGEEAVEETEDQDTSKKENKKKSKKVLVGVSKEGKKDEEKPTEKEEEEEEVEKDPFIELQSSCRTAMARNVVRSLFNPDMPKVNELFFPGRMAYVIDLEEEFAESDIPTTTIRSKADVEGSMSQQVTLSTNDIVINKLTQILSYLRAGSRHKKKKKDKHGVKREDELLREQQKAALSAMPIYDDVDHYNTKEASSREHRRDKRSSRNHRDGRRDDRRDRERGRSDGGRYHSDEKKKISYFDKPVDTKDTLEDKAGLSKQDKDYIKNLTDKERQREKRVQEAGKGGLGLAHAEPDGYAECYPGLDEMNDAIDDSDEEADYTKMDLGNKKGPVGRWDFDTAEEYSDYMSKKEAMPKAAFQYGVKMTEGRKTRGKVGAKNEKAKLDREWNKISAIIDKRKTGPGGGSSAKRSKMD